MTSPMLLLILSCATPEPPGDTGEPAAADTDTDEADDTDPIDTSDSGESDTDTGGGETDTDTGGGETDTDTGEPQPSETAVADFHLEDLNPASSSYTAIVSPRDYLEQVSGWYFIHAT